MKYIILIVALLSLQGCDGANELLGLGTSSNPATKDRADLNQPKALTSITGDGKITLEWRSFNAEEDFQGFMVFGAEKSLEDLYELVKYPRELGSADELRFASFPRCEDNSDFFMEFGFPATDNNCDGAFDTEIKAVEDDISTLSMLESASELDNFLSCSEDPDAVISVKTSDVALGRQVCTVDKIVDDGKKVAIVNGKTYTFFVMSVMESDYSKSSWASNLVEDAPSADVFPRTEITLSRGDFGNTLVDAVGDAEYAYFPLDGSNTITLPTNKTCAISGSNSLGVCSLSQTNSMVASADGFYIARDDGSDSSNGFPQRIFISTPEAGKIDLNPVGIAAYGSDCSAAEMDTVTSTCYSGRLPGDSAITTFPTSRGTKFIVKGDQIFDFKVTHDDDTYNYGKVVISGLSYASATNNKDAVKMYVQIIYQPTAKLTYYLQ